MSYFKRTAPAIWAPLDAVYMPLESCYDQEGQSLELSDRYREFFEYINDYLIKTYNLRVVDTAQLHTVTLKFGICINTHLPKPEDLKPLFDIVNDYKNRKVRCARIEMCDTVRGRTLSRELHLRLRVIFDSKEEAQMWRDEGLDREGQCPIRIR